VSTSDSISDVEAEQQDCKPFAYVAVSKALAIGQNCPVDNSLPPLYVNGNARVDGQQTVQSLGFPSPRGEIMTSFSALSEKVTGQTGVDGALRVDGRFAVGTAPSDDTSKIARCVVRAPDGSVPSQVWQDSAGAGLSGVDAQGRLGVGTTQPTAPLTVRGMFLQKLEGTLTGLANIKTLTGNGTNFQRDLVRGDWLSIPTASPTLYQVMGVDEKEQKIEVDPAPLQPINSAQAYVDGPLLRVSGGANNSVVQVDRRGAVSGIASNWSGSLTVTGLSTLKGGAQITGNTSVSQGKFTIDAPDDGAGNIIFKQKATISADARLHIAGAELLYVLNKQGMIVGKELGGNGNLTVQGTLYANGGIAQENWKAPSFINNWANFASDWAGAGFCKDAVGFVRLRGLIAHARDSWTSSLVAFTLPTGYRPATRLLFPSMMGEPWGATRIDIGPDGQVWAGFPSGFRPTSTSVWITLNAVQFKAEQ